MTVSSIVPVNNYTGNSSTTQFDFDFLIEAEEELVVQHTDSDGIISTLTLGVDYSINETGNEEGSYIIFPLSTSSYNVLSRDETISLMLTLTIKQESEFKNSSYFNFTILEWTFDYIVRILQILSRQIERCVKVNEGSNSTADNILEELNNVLSTCITSAEFVSESQEQISEYVENIEQQISDFNTTYADCYQNILNSDVNTKLSQNQITNCILELPNRIKLELNSGTLTVKSGSVMIYPNGLDDDGNKAFEYYEVTSDISISSAGTLSSDCMFNLTTTKNGINILQMDGWYSGTSEPEVSGTALWYDTSNNLIKCTTDSGSNWTGASSLPFVIIERSSGTITRIKQILNGIGVIGNTIWIDEGVKIAVPNGRNEDGSLNNTIITNPGISIIEITNDGMEHTLFIRGPLSGTDTFYIRTPGASSLIFYQDTLPESSNTNQYWFDTYNNIWKYSSDAGASWTEFDWIGRVGTFTIWNK